MNEGHKRIVTSIRMIQQHDSLVSLFDFILARRWTDAKDETSLTSIHSGVESTFIIATIDIHQILQ